LINKKEQISNDKNPMTLKVKEKRFKEILTTYRSKIYRLCYSYVKNHEDIQDLFHDILVRIWRGLESFKNKSSISTWIYRISVNSCIDFIRGEKKRDASKKKTPINDQYIFNDFSNTEENFFHSERIKSLYQCINRLSLMDNTIISLYLEDLSYKDIGEIVGISENHIGVKLHRIKKEINKQLEEFDK
jgi:RNA polymerase sigma-70 factor (ECF subfamily)